MQHKVSRRMAWLSAAAAAVIVAGLTTLGGPAAEGAANAPAASPAASGGTRIAYYDQWSIYQNAYYPKNVDALANNVDYLLYDFENVDPTNLTCFENTKASDPDPAGENDPNAGDGAGDAFADYQKSFGSDISVDGTADAFGMPIVGNFHQLQELKARHPNLKVVLSLGGWTYSKYFSDVAASDASRKKFVSSCIDMFIKGNLPSQGGYGGPGTAAASSTASTSTGSTPAPPPATSATTSARTTPPTTPRCSPNSARSSTRWAASTTRSRPRCRAGRTRSRSCRPTRSATTSTSATR